jgi:hypothetical protein
VRITTEVNDALKGMAGQPGEARSVTQIVDDTLRQLTGLAEPAPPAEQAKARARPASMARPRARGQRPEPRQLPTAAPAKCPHPVGRRIDGRCMACGASCS